MLLYISHEFKNLPRFYTPLTDVRTSWRPTGKKVKKRDAKARASVSCPDQPPLSSCPAKHWACGDDMDKGGRPQRVAHRRQRLYLTALSPSGPSLLRPRLLLLEQPLSPTPATDEPYSTKGEYGSGDEASSNQCLSPKTATSPKSP